MIRKWNLSSGKAGFKIHTYEVPRHAAILEAVFDHLCWLTSGWLGGHGMPGKFWEIPVGRAVRDEEGFLENSLAGKFYDLENAVYQYSFRKEANHVRVDITSEQARAIDPKFVADMEEISFVPDGHLSIPEVSQPLGDSNVVQFKKP